jgi:GNAT superfamily N-acetyltransferase
MGMPDLALLMAEEAGEVVGYTGCGASRDEDSPPEAGEIRSLFVSPSSWRSGVGRALLVAAVDELRDRGYTEAIVWSFADNLGANAFYEAQGFIADGATRAEERFAGIPSIRYRRTL